MSDLVDELAKVLRGYRKTNAFRDMAQAVLDSGLVVSKAERDADIIPRGDAEVTVEYGVRYTDGHIAALPDSMESARGVVRSIPDAEVIVQRTVTTFVSEWTEVDDV